MTGNGTTFDFTLAGRSSAGVLIVPLIATPKPALQSLAEADRLCDGAVGEIVRADALGSEVGKLTHATRSRGFRRILAVSLGDDQQLHERHLRQAADAAARWLISEKLNTATLWLPGLANTGIEHAAAEWALGMALAGYRFEQHKRGDRSLPAKIKVHLHGSNGQLAKRALPDVKAAALLAEGVNYARQLAQQPGNVINPKTLAAEARKLAAAKTNKITCKVIEGAKLKQLNMGGLIGVGQGAEHPGRLIQLDYRGNPQSRTKLVLVGKAITFDTGGYSIKPSAGLANLKYDKTGGCTVMGIIKTAALLKLKCNVTALVAAAENMVSDRAYRAGDILTMANGKTVEVTNTDAEGRLVLADALWYGQKYCQPTVMVDMATLTGGVMVALGSVAAGLMSNDDNLSAELEECGRATRERLWRLPLWDDYQDLMKGVDSDLVNSAPKRDAHCIQGGIFLKQFVENDVPWAHLDIAAVAANDTNGGKVASGFGVRLMIEYLRRNLVAAGTK